MGVTIYANGSDTSFQMGYGGFFNLRKNIAIALDREFGEHYAGLLKCHSEEGYAAYDRRTDILIAEKSIPEDVLEFLYADDTDGTLSHRTCRKIADLLYKDRERLKTLTFGYAAYAEPGEYKKLYDFLSECYSRRRKLRWH